MPQDPLSPAVFSILALSSRGVCRLSKSRAHPAAGLTMMGQLQRAARHLQPEVTSSGKLQTLVWSSSCACQGDQQRPVTHKLLEVQDACLRCRPAESECASGEILSRACVCAEARGALLQWVLLPACQHPFPCSS